jgi:hypothetical protein|tara:strand:+ start:1776 stop:2012 length:237 start_codon:yes stop_codon:yes gene_type:complete
MEIITVYQLADNVLLDVNATIVDQQGCPVMDTFSVSLGGEQTDISKLMVFKFANVKPVSVEDEITTLVWELYEASIDG